MTTLGNERFDIGQIFRAGVQGHKSVFTILWSIVNQPVDSLPLALWKYAQQPYPERVQQAWAGGAGADAVCIDRQCLCARVDPESRPPNERLTLWR